MNRSNFKPTAARTLAVALSLALGSLVAVGAEPTGPQGGTTVTTQTTTVRTETTAVGGASKSLNDPDEMRIKSLHDRLKIKASQEPLWNDVAQVMRSNDEKMDALSAERHRKAATMSAVEDLRSYGEITEQHAIAIKTLVPAFEKLYEAMPAEQKATADSVFRTNDHKTTAKAK